MNEKFNKNAKVDKFTTMLGIAVRLIVIDPLNCLVKCLHVPLRSEFFQNLHLGEQHFKVLGIIMGIFLYLHFKIFRLASLARYYIL